MKQRFANAVSNKLSAAPDSAAKTELVEELSDNLYRRYLDTTAAGMDENTAFDHALDDLGDVGELMEYLKGLGREEELPRLTLHPCGEKHEDSAFTGSGSAHYASGSAIPSRGLRGVDVQTVNGDVTIRLVDDENAAVRLDGDVDQLEVKVTDSGVLAIRQGRTASSSFFILRGLFSADVELYLPRRRWEFVQVSAVNGDVTVDGGFELERLSVKTTSGDLKCDLAACGRLYFKSASGDLRCEGLTGDAQAETMSGDIYVSGHMGQVSLTSMSGDVELEGSAEQIRMSSMSGDVRLEAGILPEVMELSSKSGDCEARIPAAEPFTLQYKTTSGEFSSDFPMTRTSRGAIYGGGGTRTYTMTSISGDVELRKF